MRPRSRRMAIGARRWTPRRSSGPTLPPNPNHLGFQDLSVCTSVSLNRWTSQMRGSWDPPPADCTAVLVTWTVDGVPAAEVQLAGNATSSDSAQSLGNTAASTHTYSFKVKFRNSVGDSPYVNAGSTGTASPC